MGLKDRLIYTLESIKNRYPCKIISIKNLDDKHKATSIVYQAATRSNVRSSNIEDLLNDESLVEKFHPADCIKLGLISAYEICRKKDKHLEDLKDIIKNIFGEDDA